jgi:hypothetical protein
MRSTKRAPVVSAAIERDEVPSPRVHETHWLDDALGALAVARGVVEGDDATLVAGFSQQRQEVRVHTRPRSLEQSDGLAQHVGSVAQPGWEHALQLGQGTQGCFSDSGGKMAPRRSERDGDGECLVFGERERGQAGARSEAITPRHAGLPVHRVAEPAQTIDVASQRAIGDLEPLDKLGTGPVALAQKQGEKAQQASRGFEHLSQCNVY